MDELVDETILHLIAKHTLTLGKPNAGSMSDVWSMKSCCESYACLHGSFAFDGDMVQPVLQRALHLALQHALQSRASSMSLTLCVQPPVSEVTGLNEYSGMMVDATPILAFTQFHDKHHTGEALVKWKKAALAAFQMEQCVGLATEDGASNNKKANRILQQDQAVCCNHDIARAVSTKTCRRRNWRRTLRRLTSKHALIPPLVYGHVVLLKNLFHLISLCTQ